MKNNLYIFDEKGVASDYGIGKYIQSVISVCADASISITVVSLEVEGKLNCYISKEGTQYMDIPLLRKSSGDLLNLDEKEDRKIYAQYVVSVLQLYIPLFGGVVFHLNYTQDYYLAKSLKEMWPESRVVLTVHYFAWSLALSGNICRLMHIISKREADLSENEKAVIYSGLFEQRLFKQVDFIICLSCFSKQILSDYYDIPENKLWLIPNGIKDEYQKIDRKQLRAKYGIPDDEKMLLFVGRLDKKKGLAFLIDAFKRLISEGNSNSHLYIIGGGDFNVYLSLCYPYWNRVTFCGRILPEHVSEFYQMSDIGILPSLTEQCSFVVLEMMMNRLPIIGTDSSGLDEMIIEGGNGYKVHLQEEEDRIDFPVEELAAYMKYLLQLQSLEKYGEQSRDLYLRYYTYKCMQDRLCLLYRLCLQGKEVSCLQSPFRLL